MTSFTLKADNYAELAKRVNDNISRGHPLLKIGRHKPIDERAREFYWARMGAKVNYETSKKPCGCMQDPQATSRT